MFGDIRRLIGAIRAYEKGDQIVVEGVPAHLMMGDIKRIWGTSRVATHMFTKTTRNTLAFYKFYAIELQYVITTLLQEPKSLTSPRALKHLLEVLEEQTWLVSTVEEPQEIFNWRNLNKFHKTPLDSQREFLEEYSRNTQKYNLKGYYLAAPPGSGKTLTGLFLSELLETDLVIMVVPPNAVHRVWKATIDTELKPDYPTWNSVDRGEEPRGCKHYIFHYQALDKAMEMMARKRPQKPMVIIDEGHNFNEIDSLRTSLLVRLCSGLQVENVLWASGTPLKAVGYEAIPFLRTIDPYFSEQAEQGFRKLFGKQATKALDILANRLGNVMHRVDKKSVVDNRVTEATISVKVPNAERFTLEAIKEEMVRFIHERMKYYRDKMPELKQFYGECLEIHKQKLKTEKEREKFQLYGKFILKIRKGYEPAEMREIAKFCNQYELKEISPNLPDHMRKPFRDVRSVIKYVELKVRGECLGRILGKRRSECHVEMVRHSKLPETIEGSIKKTLVFSSFVSVVEHAERYLKEEGFKPLMVYGKTNKDLRAIIDTFERDIDANPLVATYDSLSTAVPLVMANTVVLLNSPFRSHEYEQTVSRVDRLGQDADVFVYTTLLDTGSEPNISTRSKDIMEWSQNQVNAMLGVKVDNDDIASLESFAEDFPEEVSLENRVELGYLPMSALL